MNQFAFRKLATYSAHAELKTLNLWQSQRVLGHCDAPRDNGLKVHTVVSLHCRVM
jgi:hypothetical protein